MKHNFSKGFTLMEAMITVAILGILAAVAMPMYVGYVQTTSRSDATIALLNMSSAQEQRSMRLNAAYTADESLIGGVDTKQKYYTLSVSNVTPTGYELSATAVAAGPQAGDAGCTVLKLTSAGVKTPPDCWVK